MPSPTSTVSIVPIPESNGHFQVGDDDRKYKLEHGNNVSANVNKLSKDYQMALVLVGDSEVENNDQHKDGLSLLVKNWSPLSKQIWRRDSCEFTNCVFPCVKKATAHLQELQEQLTKLSQEESNTCPTQLTDVDTYDEASPSPLSEGKSLVSEELSRISSPDLSSNTGISTTTNDFNEARETPLQVSQLRTTTALSTNLTPSSRSVKSSVYHMGRGVVDEVVRLLGRLERDRITTQQMLTQEITKVNQLGSEIDKFAVKRLMELPAAVQKEHESCVTDINELKWHCAHRGRLETRLKKRVEYAENQYGKFMGDVESAKQSCPLVVEKLELEALAIASIQAKQDETDEELRETLKRLEATQQKTNEAKKRAAQERALIKKDVDTLRNLLNEVSDGLAQLKMIYTSNVHTVSDIRNTLKENTQQCCNLEKREERVKTQEAAAQDKVLKLRQKISEQGAEHVRLVEENEMLRKDNRQSEEVYNSNIAKMRMEIKTLQVQVREMARLNKSIREDLESAEKHVQKSQKQQTSDRKSLVRAAQEIEKIKQQNEVMGEETKKVAILNNTMKSTKSQLEADYFAEEETLKNLEFSLRNQLKEETHMRTVLQARIASDTSDLFRSRIESHKKRAKVCQQAEDATKVVSTIKDQVSKLEKARDERSQIISQLDDVLGKVLKQREEMESKYRTRITELRPKEENAQKEKVSLDQQLDQIAWRSEKMEKKMSDMASSSLMMTRVTDSTKDDIEELEEDTKETKLRLESAIETERSLKEALDEATERGLCRKNKHKEHLENRTSVLKENLNCLEDKLTENKELAEKYQKNYSMFMQLKESVLKYFESLVNEESHLKDHKELHVLQGRMRECLQHYYKQRGLRNKFQVAQFKVDSQKNNNKVFELKQELTNVITHINNFLESNNAAHVSITADAAMMAQTPVR